MLARYLGVFQLVVMYVSTGLAKNGNGWWYPWDAVYLALQRWPYVRWGELPWLADVFPLTQVATVASWWWEVLFVVLGAWFLAHWGWLGTRLEVHASRFDLRWPFLGTGLVVHGVLALFLNLGTFTAVTLAFYLLCLDPPAGKGVPAQVGSSGED